MGWSGKFVFGDTYAAYFGSPGDTSLHQHAAYQLVLSVSEKLEVYDDHGTEWCGSAFLIPPLMMHSIRGGGSLAVIYLDTHSVLVKKLKDIIDTETVVELSEADLPFSRNSTPQQILKVLRSYSQTPSTHIDTRLAKALSKLGEEPGLVSISEVAQICKISESRLRFLAHEELGLPISTWLIWRKLERASKSLADGVALAEAALIGGFSDQAHFTRTMRRMIGMTPREVIGALT